MIHLAYILEATNPVAGRVRSRAGILGHNIL